MPMLRGAMQTTEARFSTRQDLPVGNPDALDIDAVGAARIRLGYAVERFCPMSPTVSLSRAHKTIFA
jgi:hypothetical protein